MVYRNLSGALMTLANELRGEADRWSGGVRRGLLHATDQTRHTALTLASTDELGAEAILDAATDLLVLHMTRRLERDHLNGARK